MPTYSIIDGSTFDLVGQLNLRFRPTTFAVWRVEGKDHLFGAGNIAYAREYAGDMGVQEFDQAYDLQAGQVSIGWWTSIDSPDGQYRSDRILGIWEGSSSSFWTTFPDDSPEYLVWLLNQFRIEEMPSGLQISPTGSVSATVRYGGSISPHALHLVPGFGLMDISGLDQIRIGTLPPWEGAPVAGGELFQLSPIEMTNGESRIPFLLVTPTAWVYLSPELGLGEAVFLEQASELQVEWVAEGTG